MASMLVEKFGVSKVVAKGIIDLILQLWVHDLRTNNTCCFPGVATINITGSRPATHPGIKMMFGEYRECEGKPERPIIKCKVARKFLLSMKLH